MKKLHAILVIVFLGILSIPLRLFIDSQSEKNLSSCINDNKNAPACVQMYSSISKHSEKYGIPLRYALGIAYVESSYKGPLQWSYKHDVVSSAGALGPMQIMPTTADMMWNNKRVPREKILKDIDFNVETSMKLLAKLYKKYGDWKIVFGYYNTGRPCVNDYAEKVYNFKTNKI